MTVRSRILKAASELLARSADADISTRAVCEAAGVTAPTLYHHFGDKEGLLAAVVDFGWAAFLESKRSTAAVVHAHIADDIRAGWDNHLEFARENPNFYKLIWSPAISANSAAFGEAFQMLRDRLELGASRGQLRVSAETGARHAAERSARNDHDSRMRTDAGRQLMKPTASRSKTPQRVR